MEAEPDRGRRYADVKLDTTSADPLQDDEGWFVVSNLEPRQRRGTCPLIHSSGGFPGATTHLVFVADESSLQVRHSPSTAETHGCASHPTAQTSASRRRSKSPASSGGLGHSGTTRSRRPRDHPRRPGDAGLIAPTAPARTNCAEASGPRSRPQHHACVPRQPRIRRHFLPEVGARLGAKAAKSPQIGQRRWRAELAKVVALQQFSREPPRGLEPRTYALRAVRKPPRNSLLLVHTPAYPAIVGHTPAMFRVISGAFREPHRPPGSDRSCSGSTLLVDTDQGARTTGLARRSESFRPRSSGTRGGPGADSWAC